MAERFTIRKIEGPNESIKCIKCKSRIQINSLNLCKRCFALEQIVNSGNKNIDDFIKKSQSPKYGSIAKPFLEWVPYEKFTNVEYIGKGGFSEIYKATWEKLSMNYQEISEAKKTEVVLKVLNDSQNVDNEFIKELKNKCQMKGANTIQCYGVTQIPKTKNYAFILEYAKYGDLHHFLNKNFVKITWRVKILFLKNIVKGIGKIHKKKILYRDLHSGNILMNEIDKAIISDLGFSQPATIKPNLSRNSQIYGIIPNMAPELFKGQSHLYSSDIYSLGMIMWQLTSGHRPFHDQEHGPKLILDILDGKRPEITEDTPKCWADLMKRCWRSDPSQRPTIKEIYKLTDKFDYYKWRQGHFKKHYPDMWLEFNKAEKKRYEMVKSKKPFVKNPGYEHPNSRNYSMSLNSMLESINSIITDIYSNDNLFSNDHFDINSFDQINDLENSDGNSSVENNRKHFLDESPPQEIIEDQNDYK
ncbi:hypothetical protein Glove_213g2 [Diversispora epigaea]|uniref:Protein kinase domain-containing protein n=1 Tax=Diversispora epigaea TaxID=1348612 RepID=A0A397IRX8_9GLOM|nr:hypothetical protein Glove_213g2 [Diversispora epigaea]